MADGSTKPIEDVRVGDLVLAADPESGEIGKRLVTHVINSEGPKELVAITVGAGTQPEPADEIVATDNHPFWAEKVRRWVEASDLRPGDLLRTPSGAEVQVASLRTWSQPQAVYNLTVADIHTYYVIAGRTPVLVHNCPPAGGAVPSGQQGRGLQIPDGVSKGQWLKDRAGALGFSKRVPAQKVPFDSKGQAAFFDGKRYITPDITGHNTLNGWKMFDRKGNRLGTYDSDLNYLKP
ncbi:polymorphic toxin-type HINT domain-containing protein [Micromonospora andamanensis]|nr:polymorphic toxin-type HINT domain-containing protein [Micromonospora andamanensis]